MEPPGGGAGKFGTPWLRMHCTKASASWYFFDCTEVGEPVPLLPHPVSSMDTPIAAMIRRAAHTCGRSHHG